MSALVWIGFLVAAAGGAVLRFIVEQADSGNNPLPRGLLVVNVGGSLVLGVLVGLGRSHALGKSAMAVVGTGFCGALTTFSAFTYETVRLAEDGALDVAWLNVAVTVAACGAAAALGWALGMAVG